MANEKRLIDANAFWNRLQQVVYDVFTVHEKDGQLTGTASVGYYTETIAEVLKQTKTVDAVEVVRCAKCKHWRNASKPLYCNEFMGDCTIDDEPVGRWEHDFCSYGERRTDG